MVVAGPDAALRADPAPAPGQSAPEPGVGVVVHSLSGMYAVATPEGTLLCRPRGRLRGKGAGAWRDERDADRTDSAMRPGEDADGDVDAAAQPDGVPAAAEDPERPGDVPPPPPRARPAAGARPVPAPTSAADPPVAATPPGRGRPVGGRAEPPAAGRGGHDGRIPAVLAGDRVRYSRLPDGEGAVDAVLPRRSLLLRPAIANADHVLVVVAWESPPFSAAFVDRVLILAALSGCAASLVCNKGDTLDAAQSAAAEAALLPYRAAGYAALVVSAVTQRGMDGLHALLADRLTVLAGPSGSGKSRLIAALCPDRPPRSAEVSERGGRGRHTTRSVELLPLPGGGWVADTPGFSRLDFPDLAPEDLPGLYPEFGPYLDGCRFRGCGHDTEPDCVVRDAVAARAIDRGRYERYRQLLAELRARRPRW